MIRIKKYRKDNVLIAARKRISFVFDHFEKIYIAFSPQKPESHKLAKILSEGMLKLRESGKLEEILNKYGLSDWI